MFPTSRSWKKAITSTCRDASTFKQEGSWLLFQVLYLQLQWQMNVTTSSKLGLSQVGAFEIPILTHRGMELRILPLDHPYPPAVIAEQWVWLFMPCSETSLKTWRDPGEKTTLQQTRVQHPFTLAVRAVTSCHSLPGSLTWKTNVVHFPGILLWAGCCLPCGG